MMWLGDPLYYLAIIPGLVLACWAQSRVIGARFKGSRTMARSGRSGAEVASQVFRDEYFADESIARGSGPLSDFYDPRGKVLRLSPTVFDGRSLTALGTAGHEAGHALQRANRYPGLIVRTILVPAA